MVPSPSLAELQRWMRWALTHPLGAVRATGGEAVPGLPERFDAPSPSRIGAVSGEARPGRTAVDRLSVYASGYFGRLLGTLELEFPRLAAALGSGRFRELVAAHLLRRPSTSPSLADLGEGLADTLRMQTASVDAPWLVDLARLERAAAEVWLSDASARGPIVSADEDWARVRLALSPTARLLLPAWDVAEWDGGAVAPAAGPLWLVLCRVEASTGVQRLDEAPGRVLEAIEAGGPLGEASALAGRLGMSAEDLGAAFATWAGHGWLTRRDLRDAP